MLDAIRKMAADGRTRGWYLAQITSVARSWRRVQLRPSWTTDALEHARRISSPILDVIPAVGTRVAVISEDGVIEAPAVIGQVWDDASTAEDMTAWLRAHLAEHPGHLELGATQGVRLRVGENTVDITPLEDGRLHIEATGTVVLDAPRIELGDGASDGLVRHSDLKGALSSIKSAFNNHTHSVSGTTAQATAPPLVVDASSSTTSFSL